MIYDIDTLRNKILELIHRYRPNILCHLLKSIDYHDSSIRESLKFYCPKVASDEYSIQTKIYWFLNGLKDFPKCMNNKCSNTFEHKNVINIRHGYRKHCCSQCAKDSDDRKNLYVETCRKNYGVNNISQLEATKKKKEQKALEKYGVTNVAKAPEVQKIIQQTNLDKYGKKMYMLTDEALANRRKKHLKEYGVDWPQKSREFMRNMQKRYIYNGMNFDSKPELAYYIWLKDHNIEFEYQPNVSFEYEYDGEKHVYEPDFIVEGICIEIKGDHFFKEDGTMQNPFDHSQDALYEAKHQCMLNNSVKMMKSNEYNVYVKYVEEKYGKNYLYSFKNK